MDELRLKAILDSEIKQAVGFVTSEVSEQRAKALDYFYGEPYGNEIPDRSQVVTREVADTIGWIMPSLMRMFCSGDDIFTFEPVGPGDEAKAKQATDYVNYIFTRDNNGFLVLYSWFFDALLQKNGVVKTYWEQKSDVTEETYEGLTDEELSLLLSDEEIEPVEHTERTVEYSDESGQLVTTRVHDIKVKKISTYGCVKTVNVPPEEFLISQRATCIQDAPFVAHRVQKTRSELIEMGYDRKLIESIGTDSGGRDLQTPEELARFDIDDTDPRAQENADDSMRLITVNECYIRVDYDDDGIAELRKITYAGNRILDNEKWDRIPFDAITPILIPHKFFGLSIADIIMDLQLIKSTVTRQILDNMYHRNNARMFVQGQVNLDDLLNPRPGGIVRGMPGSVVTPLRADALGADAYSLLEYIDQLRENRTGVSPRTQGLGENSLHKTASGETMLYSAAMGKIELIARIFAEVGLKELARSILHMVCKHQQRERIIRLRGEWVPMDPREWSTKMDVSVSVGLGNSNVETQRLAIQSLLNLDAQIVQLQGGVNGPLLTAENVYAKLSKLVETFGWKDIGSFYTDPKDAPPPPPKPDPEVVKAQNELQLRQQEAQFKAQLEQQKAQLEAQLEERKAQKQAEIEAMQAQADIEVKREEANLRMQLERMKAASQIEIAKFKAQMDSRMAIQAARIRQREARRKASPMQ